jgi:hypothetical protein
MVLFVFDYFNRNRFSLIEPFVVPVNCSPDNMRLYEQDRGLYEDEYNQCFKITSIRDVDGPQLDTEQSRLERANKALTYQLSQLTSEHETLSNNITLSNAELVSRSNINTQLTQCNIYLNSENSNLTSISNLLLDMDALQGTYDSLSNLEYTIIGEMCTQMLNGDSNCGVTQKEDFTKDKLQEILQAHIRMIPYLSESYLLAVKLWIAYNKAEGLVMDTDREHAIDSYNSTLDTLKAAEKSMYNVKVLYNLYKSNLYYTSSNASNANFSLSNNDEVFDISYTGNQYMYTSNSLSDTYNKLFETCSNNIESTSNIFIITDLECASSNYDDMIESISNCTDRPDCERAQSSNVQSGLEYIYRNEFSRDDVNLYPTSTSKNTVDDNIINMFISKVFA